MREPREGLDCDDAVPQVRALEHEQRVRLEHDLVLQAPRHGRYVAGPANPTRQARRVELARAVYERAIAPATGLVLDFDELQREPFGRAHAQPRRVGRDLRHDGRGGRGDRRGAASSALTGLASVLSEVLVVFARDSAVSVDSDRGP